jgi:hypothetical protein
VCQNPTRLNGIFRVEITDFDLLVTAMPKPLFFSAFRADKQRCRDSGILFDAVQEDRQDASIRRIKTLNVNQVASIAMRLVRRKGISTGILSGAHHRGGRSNPPLCRRLPRRLPPT